MTKNRIITYAAVGAGIVLLFVLGAIYDLTISNTIFQPGNVMAVILESVGIIPPFLFVASAGVVLFFLVERDKAHARLKMVGCIAVATLSYLLFGYMATEPFFEVFWVRFLVGVGVSGVLTPLNFFAFRKRSRDTLKRCAVFLILASIVAVAASGVLINVIKFLWGRPRYREMIADGDTVFAAFTPWYHPNGFTLHGHHSFPSGHTCSAAILLTLCAIGEVFEQRESNRRIVAFMVGFYILVMAYSRVVLGAHFLSDVTGGFTVGFLTYAIVRYLYFDKSRLVMTAIMKINLERELKEKGEEEQTPPEEEPDLPPEEIEIPAEPLAGEEEMISHSVKVIEVDREYNE